ncbi:hypothetical protein [Bradyrhizobium sp. ORS 285]|uniref:hypothetical protein n=1 Tax=Bradyrhizobium sp. ORS 285 TaxID=115808 RepID=UPI001AEBDA6C|nr:hypothetical protein [Bradyrhizobium sp. ORS 285]
MVSGARTMGVGAYLLVGALVLMLVAVIVVAILGWSSAEGTDVPSSGYAALAIGVVFSMVCGVGLMVLVFYSSRAGYDEPPKLVADTTDDEPGSERNAFSRRSDR